MPAGEQADQQLLHHFVLADDGLGDGRAQLAEPRQLRLQFRPAVRIVAAHNRSRNRPLCR